MGLFDHFPYSNFHELNLEWVVRILRALDSKVDGLDGDVKKLTDEVKNFIEHADIPGVVRDTLLAMYDDGRLAELVSEAVVAISDKITYHFIGGGVAGSGGSVGTAIWVDTVEGAIIMDFGFHHTALRDALITGKVKKIKAIIISHYHDDHIGGDNHEGFDAVLDYAGFDFTGCKAYLPHGAIQWERLTGADFTPLQADRDEIIALLEAHNIEWVEPTEGYTDTEQFRNLSLTFNNLSPNYFAKYYSYQLNANGNVMDPAMTQYNNFSMITSINHYSGYSFVYGGDCHEPAEHNNYRVFIGKDIVVANHHGLNRLHDAKFCDSLTPQVYVISTGATAYPLKTYYHADYAQAMACGAKCFFTYETKGLTIEDSARSLKAVPVSSLGETMNGPASPDFYTGIVWTKADIEEGTNIETDLNKIVKPSVYSCPNTETAKLLTNTPFDHMGFILMTKEVSASHTLMQVAQGIGSNSYLLAYRRAAYDGSALDTFQWRPWRFIAAGIYNRMEVTESMFDVNGVELHTGISQNYIEAVNNTLTVGLDFECSNTIGAGDSVLSFHLDTSGVGAYGALFDSAGNVYPCSVRYHTDDREKNYYVRMVKSIPAGTEVFGCLVVGLSPTHE